MGILKKSRFVFSTALLGLGVSCNFPNQIPSKMSQSVSQSVSRLS